MADLIDNQDAKRERLTHTAGTALSERSYNLVIGGVLLWGIVVNIIMAFGLTDLILSIHPAAIIVIYIIGSIGSSIVIFKSNNPAVSFAGFTVLAICMGLILTYFITMYDIGTVTLAFEMTAIVTVAMMILGTLFPSFFLSIGGGLGIALFAGIIVELIFGLLLHKNMRIMDYVFVLIFSGFIGFDWAKAQAYPKTLDNAIDSAADIYVDVVNIFIRLLEIFGNSSND